MPLARIITRYPAHASDLAQQLHLQGFSVDLSDPDETDLPPADLEIDFEICNPAQVLEYASRRASDLEADVVVASGALDSAAPAGIAPLEHQPPGAEAHFEPQAAHIQTIPAQSTEDELSHELPSYNARFATNLGSQLRESLSNLNLGAAELRKVFVEQLRTTTGNARRRMAMTQANLATVAESLASHVHEYQERMKQKAAEAEAERECHRLEVVSQMAEAQKQGATLQAQGQEPEPHKEKQKELAAAVASGQPLQTLPAPGPARRRSSSVRAQRTRLQLRGIFTGAVAASALFVVGMVLANVHPQSPLPASITQRSGEQHLPFGAVIVQGTPAQSKINAIQPLNVSTHTALKRQERTPTLNQSKPHPYPANKRANKSSDGSTSDDVVVRHYPAQVIKPAHAQQAKLKRYSDLDK